MDINYGLVALNIVTTWVLGLSVPLCLRYGVLERPMTRAGAVAVCIVSFIASFVIAVAAGAKSVNALFLVALVSYFILVAPKRGGQQGEEKTSPPVSSQTGWSDSDRRPPIDGFERVKSHSNPPGELQTRSAATSQHAPKSAFQPDKGSDGGFREKLNSTSSFERSLIIAVLVFVLVLTLYYVASPYQNCIERQSERWCTQNTSW